MKAEEKTIGLFVDSKKFQKEILKTIKKPHVEKKNTIQSKNKFMGFC